MVNDPDIAAIMADIEAAPFTATSKKGHYTGNLAHEYIMSHRLGVDKWLQVRDLIAKHGVDRMFFRTRFRYLDWNGYTYWVMPPHLRADWRSRFDPTENHVLNRQKISDDLYSGSQR